jgi:hypothetical protein
MRIVVILYWLIIFIIASTEMFQPFDYYFNGVTWGCFGASFILFAMLVDFKSKENNDASNACGIALGILMVVSLTAFGH